MSNTMTSYISFMYQGKLYRWLEIETPPTVQLSFNPCGESIGLCDDDGYLIPDPDVVEGFSYYYRIVYRFSPRLDTNPNKWVTPAMFLISD